MEEIIDGKEVINWEVFTREEKDALMILVNQNMKEHFSSVIHEMTQEKEYELQKIGDQLKPLVEVEESEEKVKFQKERLEKGLSADPTSPEEEKELQAKLDAEIGARHEARKEQNKKRLEVVKSAKKSKK
jgi:hypothetical protein